MSTHFNQLTPGHPPTKDFETLQGAEKTIGNLKGQRADRWHKSDTTRLRQEWQANSGNPARRRDNNKVSVQLMQPLKDPARVEHCSSLLRDMMLTRSGEECEFNSGWIRSHGWKVVPAESLARIPVPDIPRIISALNGAGFTRCLAVFNEPGYIQSLPIVVASDPPGDMATCYLLSVDEADLREFNRELGLFRSVLTTDDRTWAISCGEWYNLFGGKPELIEAMLGKSIEQARQEFQEYATLLATGQNPDESFLRVAEHYAVL